MNAAPADVFAALGDPTRLRVLSLLGDAPAQTATELTRRVDVSRPAVIKHLGVLQRAGLVTRTKSGRDVRYRVRLDDLDAATRWLERRGMEWDRRLAGLRDLALGDRVPRRAPAPTPSGEERAGARRPGQ